MAKRRMVIEVDEEAQSVKVTSDEGELNLESIVLFGGDARNQEFFVRMYGASSDAAWAFGQGFKLSRMRDAGRGIKNFFKQAAAHCCQIIDPDAFKQEASANEILNRWEDPNQERWFAQDSEDVLEDKQVAEGRKPRWN
jgi:hypothetical protein